MDQCNALFILEFYSITISFMFLLIPCGDLRLHINLCIIRVISCFLHRKMAKGDMVVHLLAGKALLQREAVRFLWGSFLEISLRMNWYHSVKK